jgi:hypothetical protein
MMIRKTILTSAVASFVAVTACGTSPSAPDGLVAGVASRSALAAKGGNPGPPPPPPSDQPAVGAFRCPGPECIGVDRLTGDGNTYVGKIWGSTGEFRLDLTDPSRSLTLDYSDQLDGTIGRRWTSLMTITGASGAVLQTNVMIPGTSTEAPNGLRAIPIGDTWPARMRLGFNITSPTGVDLVWGNRFNEFYAGSTLLSVTRVSTSQWIIEATPGHIDYALSIADRRHGGEVFEGLYRLPFRLTVTTQ